MRDPCVKLKLAHAKTIQAQLLDGAPAIRTLTSALGALQAAIAAAEALAARKKARPAKLAHPKPSKGAARLLKARAKDEHRERMRVIRDDLVKRSGMAYGNLAWCERCREALMADPHHLFGRGKGRLLESERNCVGLCRTCHEWMHEPPTLEAAVEGWDWAGRHLEALGFGEEAAMCWARAKKCRTRAELSRAGEAVRAIKDEVV